ncbi:M23 family metallopeptidase [Nocardioides panacisoli]|uniref:M23 family metallopeptidase n=1 Tax=Nocardioides panacisoli TaxID=627624 RepID=UPI001C62A933|nr:M23 family metallopeptidase [Nocardioides panacisoli]QYJ03429.1 M23 family metallopeptidase [Nocardioides panacisoli]
MKRTTLAGLAAPALLLSLVASGCSAVESPVAAVSSGVEDVDVPEVFTPVLVTTVGVETAPVQGRDGSWRVLYELVLTNAKPAPARIDRLDVVDADDTDAVVASFEGEDLVGLFHRLSGGPRATTSLAPDETAMVFVELTFDDLDDAPDAVAHRIVGEGAANPAATDPSAVDYVTAGFPLRERSQVVMGPPLRGDGWLAVNGLDTTAGVHRGAVQSIGGRLYDAQRFAIDWMRLDEDGMLATGDSGQVESWNSYDEPVLAVADAEVVQVLDELPDQAPGTLPDPSDITLETVDGNHVILELAEGVYAFYAHLKEGSITLEEGDSVSAGDEIGRLGNSGNTSAPHLHLHVMTADSALAADSIPYTFDGFTHTGRISDRAWNLTDGLEGPWTVETDGAGEEHTEQVPLGLDVVEFPED